MDKIELAKIDLLALIGGDADLKRVATTKGGEYAGVCPLCKYSGRRGAPRFKVWPMHPDGWGQWHCFNCGAGGDAIDYIQARDGCGFREALEVLGLQGEGLARLTPAAPKSPKATPSPRPIPWKGPPSAAWQAAARVFCEEAAARLWAPAGAKALAYLRRRGLTEETIRAAGLGYNATEQRPMRESWGLPPHPDHPHVWLPQGIVIPWEIAGDLWRVNIRRPLTKAQLAAGEDKYIGPVGFHNGLYRADTLAPGRPAILVEGEFDALTIHQHAGDLVAAVATGSIGGGRELPWLARLALCSVVLVAFDAESEPKKRETVERAATYWLDALGRLGRRWRPLFKDANSMATEGIDLRAWIEAGLESIRPAQGAVAPSSSPGPVSADSEVIGDPRPDLAEDSGKWEQVLTAAHAHDGRNPRGLYAGLSFLRCMGARLRPDAGRWTFRLGALGDQAEQERLYDTYLQPYTETLRLILGRPAEGACTTALGGDPGAARQMAMGLEAMHV